MDNFNKYSQYYDLIYREKNYLQEVRFVEKILRKYSQKKVKKIVSLGCGSGNHEILFAKRGYRILGIDKSETMLSLFREKVLKQKLDERIQLIHKNVTKFNTSSKYDCAISLFNVVGYQTENSQMEKMIKSTSKGLSKGGLFVFDCWHGPAVLKDRPTDRIREIFVGNKHIIRLTTSQLNIEKSVIEISFKVLEIVNSRLVNTVHEIHPMRYWSIPELSYFLEKGGFKLIKVVNFLDLKSKVSDDRWDIFAIAQKNR